MFQPHFFSYCLFDSWYMCSQRIYATFLNLGDWHILTSKKNAESLYREVSEQLRTSKSSHLPYREDVVVDMLFEV